VVKWPFILPSTAFFVGFFPTVFCATYSGGHFATLCQAVQQLYMGVIVWTYINGAFFAMYVLFKDDQREHYRWVPYLFVMAPITSLLFVSQLDDHRRGNKP
jgi:hypothetical protein